MWPLPRTIIRFEDSVKLLVHLAATGSPCNVSFPGITTPLHPPLSRWPPDTLGPLANPARSPYHRDRGVDRVDQRGLAGRPTGCAVALLYQVSPTVFPEVYVNTFGIGAPLAELPPAAQRGRLNMMPSQRPS